MKKYKRLIACILSFAMLLPLATIPAHAVETPVTTDEAVYVNLDHYGAVTGTSVVKGCSLNGNREFKDYGSYTKVTNMSGYDEPELTNDGVVWSLSPDANDHFFYECTPAQNSIILPWSFKVSYKLNGVPTEAQDLAGASGLVEINIECIPNGSAETYYQNNLLLQAATMVNVEDVLSIEAPGSQTQSIGTYKAVLFAALPGEHTTFTIRIGTESFEFPGVIMLMIPGTLEQMKTIKDLKEAKDTIGDSADSVYDSLDQILNALEDMSGSLELTQEGLQALQQARTSIQSAKGGIYDGADASLKNLDALSQKIVALVPHLQNGEQLVNDVSADINAMVDTTGLLASDLGSLSSSLSRLQNSMEDLEDALNDATISRKHLTNLQDAIDDLTDSFAPFEGDLEDLKGTIDRLEDPLGKLLTGLQDTKSQLDQVIADLTQKGVSDTLLAPLKKYRDRLDEATVKLEQVRKRLTDLLSNTSNTVGTLDGLGSAIDDLLDDLKGLSDLDSAADVIGELNRTGTSLQAAIATCSSFLTTVQTLNHTLNQYKEGTISLLSDCSELATQLGSTLTSTSTFLQDLESMMKESGQYLNEGTQKTLDGLIGALSEALDMSGSTSSLRDASDSIKGTVEDQLDQVEEDSNFLNLDAEAEMVSFTSRKNPAPASIQVILRTEEISLGDAEEPVEDLDPDSQPTSFWDRVVNLFQQLWESITSLFQ